jgi:hypothetical protein
MLIGWTRLLGGRFRDPMIGRDALIGALIGCTCAIMVKLAIIAPPWLGLPAPSPIRTYFTALTELRHVGFMLLNLLQVAISLALLAAFLFLLFRIMSRSSSAATVLLIVTLSAVGAVSSPTPVQIVVQCLVSTVMVLTFRRYGLLSLAALLTFSFIMSTAPLTLDTSVWYFGRSFFVMGLMTAVAAYAFWVSLADQPIFGLALLEEE